MPPLNKLGSKKTLKILKIYPICPWAMIMTEQPESKPSIEYIAPAEIAPAEAPTTQNILANFRTKIDATDSQILLLLNQRAMIVQQVGEFKKQEGLPIYSPGREEQLLRHLEEQNKGPLSATSLRTIFREILSASRALEKEVVIACLGSEGGAAYQAAIRRFGSSIKYTFFKETSDVFDQVARNEADCGVVPIESAELWLVGHSSNDLAGTELNVCAEITLGDQKNGRDSGRFLVLGRTQNPPSGFDRTLIALRVEDKPGALVAALAPFKEHSINLSHLASRPTAKGSSDLFFFVEAQGHSKDLQVSDIFRELSKCCRAVKVLGSYPIQQ